MHISTFPKGGVRPTVGELISFEIQADNNGKKRAILILRTKSDKFWRKVETKRSREKGHFVKGCQTAILAVNKTISTTDAANQKFKCDGREHCSQMNSRAEAVYFIKHCLNTKMDGDRDGIPCENDTRF